MNREWNWTSKQRNNGNSTSWSTLSRIEALMFWFEPLLTRIAAGCCCWRQELGIGQDKTGTDSGWEHEILTTEGDQLWATGGVDDLAMEMEGRIGRPRVPARQRRRRPRASSGGDEQTRGRGARSEYASPRRLASCDAYLRQLISLRRFPSLVCAIVQGKFARLGLRTAARTRTGLHIFFSHGCTWGGEYVLYKEFFLGSGFLCYLLVLRSSADAYNEKFMLIAVVQIAN
jgi:hypothetical protein